MLILQNSVWVVYFDQILPGQCRSKHSHSETIVLIPRQLNLYFQQSNLGLINYFFLLLKLSTPNKLFTLPHADQFF